MNVGMKKCACFPTGMTNPIAQCCVWSGWRPRGEGVKIEGYIRIAFEIDFTDRLRVTIRHL